MITPHDPERWARIQELFHRALEIPEQDRYTWLLARCGRDLPLWREVASLLAADAPTTWRAKGES